MSDIDLSQVPLDPASNVAPVSSTIDLSQVPLTDTTLQDNYKDVVNNKINPDHAARVFNIAKNSDFGPAMIAEDTDTAEKAVNMPDFVALSGSHPATAQFFMDKKQMAQAHDDIENLKRTEKVIEAHNLIEDIQGAYQGSSTGLMVRGKLPNIYTPEEAPIYRKFIGGLAGMASDLPAMTLGGLGGGGLPGAFAAPAMIRTALTEHYQNGEIKDIPELLRRIYSTGKSGIKGAITGKFTEFGGALGLKALEGPIGEIIGPTAMKVGTQANAKILGEAAGMTVGGAAVEGKVPTGEDIALNFATLGVLHATGAVGGKLLDIRREHITAENSKALIEHLAEVSQESKLRGRDEQSHGEFIDKQIGPALVPVEAFNTLFQSKGIDPAQAARELGVSESHTEAQTSGGLVSIPMGIMQSKVMDDYRPALAGDVKFTPDSLTLNEVGERTKEYQQTVKDLAGESDKEIKANPELQAVHDTISKDFAELAGPAMVGVKGRGAKSSVDLVSKVVADRYITEAGKRGVDALTLYNADKPKFFGPDSPMPMGGQLFQGEVSPYKSLYKPRGGWTIEKIHNHLRQIESLKSEHWFTWDKEVAKYDSAKDLEDNLFYHGTGGYVEGGLKSGATLPKSAFRGSGYDYDLHTISLSKDKNIASNFSGISNRGEVYPVLLRKEAKVISMPEISDSMELEDILPKLFSDGVDAVKIGDWSSEFSEKEIAILNPRAIIKGGRGEGYQVFNKQKFVNEDAKEMWENAVTNPRSAKNLFQSPAESFGPKSKYEKVLLSNGKTDVIRITKETDKFLTGVRVNKEGDEISKGKISKIINMIDKSAIVKRTPMQMNLKYATLDEISEDTMKQGDNDPLASYTLTDQGAVVKMFKGANASSLLHELSHHWLEGIHDFVKTGKADEAYLADWKLTQDYLGHKTGEGISTAQHEKFATSFEKYLMEGKAPSVELQTTFEKLKSWMMKVYDGVKNKLCVEISPEIRGVFDRMLASKEAIEQARADMGLESGKVEGLQGDELKARKMAESMLLKPLMDEMSAANQAKLVEERARLTGEAETTLKADPIYGAIDTIIQDRYKTGEKITEQMVRNEADKYILGELSDVKSTEYDLYAELAGLSSGDELLKKIASSDKRETALKNLVDEGMKPLEAMNDPATLKENALKALHTGDGLGRLFSLEAQVLDGLRMNKDINAELSAQRRANASREWESVKAMAAETLGNKNIKEAGKFRTYYTLERKSAERVGKAMAKKDYEGASKAKREQLVSHALAAEAIRLKDRIDRNTNYLEKQQGADKTTFKDVYHFVQVASLLDRFGLKRNDFKQTDRQETLAQWSAEYSGLPGGISPLKDWILNEAINKPFNSLTANELKDLKDTVAHIKLKANEELSIDLGGKRALISALAGEMSTAQIESGNIGHTAKTSGSKDWVDKIISGKDWVRNELVNVETLLNKLDGYKYKGIWWKALFEGSIRSLDNRAEMMFEASAKQADIWSKYSKKELSDMYSKKIFVPEFGVSITKSEIMMIAHNWGNSMNRQRLIEGSGKYEDSKGVSWTEQSIKSVLDRELDKRDWDTVQANLDHVDSFWPLIAEKYRTLYGFEPEKVKAEPIQTKYGEYRGGYFPLRKDTRLAIKGMEELKAEQALGDMPMHIAYTKNGFTKERTIGAVYPVSLDIRGVSKHMTDVIHDLNLREWVMDTSKLLNNKEVQTSIQDGLGQEGYFLIKDWVKGISGTKGYESWDSVLREMRRRTVIANLGFRIKSAALQIDDVFTYGSVDPSNYGVANVITEAAGHYVKLITRSEPLQAIVDRVYSKSKYMKFERGEYIDRDLDARAMRIFGQDTKMGEVSMSLMRAMDHMISMPAWEGAYKTGLRLFKGSESEAVDYADNCIRTAQSSSRISEMAKVMTDGEFKKALTMFYSFTSKKASMIYAATDKTKTLKQVPQLVGTYAALLIWPSLLSAFIHDYWPSDDKKKKKWLKALITAPAQLVPVVRDVADLVADKLLGLPSFGYQATPLTGGIEAIGNAAGKLASDNATGMQKVEAVAGIAPYAVPYPKQANDWLFNVADYANGNMSFEMQDITKRRPIRERN